MTGLSTTSTAHGHLQAGWSQEEEASPHIIGDTGGATRQTSFSALAKADSDLLIGQPLTVDGPFDSTGIVLDTTLVGDFASASSYDIDSQFLPVRTFPGVMSGFEEAALDQFQRFYGAGGVTLPWAGTGVAHTYYPLRGYSQGFTVDGKNTPYYQGDWGETVARAGNNLASFYYGRDAVVPNYFVRLPQGVYCRQCRPIMNPTHIGDRVNYMAFRVRLANSNTISAKLNWQFLGSALSPDCYLRISRTTGTSGTIGIDGTYRQDGAGSTTTITTATVPTTGLDMSKEIGFVIQWGYLTTAATGATLRIKIYAYDPQSPPGGAPTVVLQTDLVNAMRTTFTGNNAQIARTTGASTDYFGFRDVIISQTDNTWPVHYPVIPEPALITSNFTKTLLGTVSVAPEPSARPPIHSWTGSGWDYLKMLTSARNLQCKIESGALVFRDLTPIGAVTPLTHAASPPRLNIKASGRARNVDVMSNRSTGYAVTAVGATNLVAETSYTMRINEELLYPLDLPDGVYFNGAMKFDIIDSDGLPVSQSDMWYRGARFTPTVAADGSISVSVRGPKDAVGLGNAPWQVTAINITNVGYFTDIQRLTLYTGAPEAMITREKGGDIDNPFLNSNADVFDRSTWLISSAGSPEVTLDFTIPAAARSLYQIGQVVSYGWGHYRVMSLSHLSATTDVVANWFATQAQQSAQWVGQTANQWNTYWSGKRAYDTYLRPLASPVPVSDPKPFVRVYPSEPKWKR